MFRSLIQYDESTERVSKIIIFHTLPTDEDYPTNESTFCFSKFYHTDVVVDVSNPTDEDILMLTLKYDISVNTKEGI